MANYNLSYLKLIVYGSELMSRTLLDSIAQALPHVRLKQSFGTSETSALQTKNHEIQNEYFRILNTDYKIIHNELYLKSKTQSLGYLNADNSVFDAEGYFATGDLVEVIQLDGKQYIKILGRSKEVINVGGEKVLPQEIENVILEIPYISDCLVYGETNAITGQSVSVKVVLDSNNVLQGTTTYKDRNSDYEKEPKLSAHIESTQNLENISLLSYPNLRHNQEKESPNTNHTKESHNLNSLNLKRHIRIFCKKRLAAYKIPTKVIIVENLDVTHRFKKNRE